MPIEEGFKAVHKAMFGFGPGEHVSKGHCTRCQQELRFSPVDGNCQPDCKFRFGWANKTGHRSIFNGAWVKFEWEADLCDQCLGSLSNWLLGEGWRQREVDERNKNLNE